VLIFNYLLFILLKKNILIQPLLPKERS